MFYKPSPLPSPLGKVPPKGADEVPSRCASRLCFNRRCPGDKDLIRLSTELQAIQSKSTFPRGEGLLGKVARAAPDEVPSRCASRLCSNRRCPGDKDLIRLSTELQAIQSKSPKGLPARSTGAYRPVRRGPTGPFSLKTLHWSLFRALEPLKTVHWTVFRAFEPFPKGEGSSVR